MFSNYDINVTTQPLADKMSAVSHQVRETTVAVGVMESAVIAQEKTSADQICGKLDVGFLNVVMSQIAQRVANEKAITNALAMELLQQKKALFNLQNRMSDDYHMISARYAKLFGTLNQEMKNRITDLDKPLMQFCSQNVKQLENRIYTHISNVPVLQSESLTAMQAIAAARLKHNAQELIENVQEYVKNDQSQQVTTDRLWVNSDIDGSYYVPVIIYDENTENLNSAIMCKDNPTLRKQLDDVSYQQIVQTIESQINDFSWRQSDENEINVSNSFINMVDHANLPTRIKELMKSMFNNHFETL